MNLNPTTLFNNTKHLPIAKNFNSWRRVCTALGNARYNVWEAEAVIDFANSMRSHGLTKLGTSGDFIRWTENMEVTHKSPGVNKLIMNKFCKEYGLELNEEGVPCRRGTMPGNPGGGTILVPLGTPLCCDPTSETYWSM